MPNLDSWINQNNSNESEENIDTNTISNRFENHLLYIKDEYQKLIRRVTRQYIPTSYILLAMKNMMKKILLFNSLWIRMFN